MKVLVGTLNQEKAPVKAFLMIVKTDGSFAALVHTAAVRPPLVGLQSPDSRQPGHSAATTSQHHNNIATTPSTAMPEKKKVRILIN